MTRRYREFPLVGFLWRCAFSTPLTWRERRAMKRAMRDTIRELSIDLMAGR